MTRSVDVELANDSDCEETKVTCGKDEEVTVTCCELSVSFVCGSEGVFEIDCGVVTVSSDTDAAEGETFDALSKSPNSKSSSPAGVAE